MIEWTEGETDVTVYQRQLPDWRACELCGSVHQTWSGVAWRCSSCDAEAPSEFRYNPQRHLVAKGKAPHCAFLIYRSWSMLRAGFQNYREFELQAAAPLGGWRSWRNINVRPTIEEQFSAAEWWAERFQAWVNARERAAVP